MMGTWRWNAVVSVAAAALIFLLSFRNNPMNTTLYRTLIAFVVLFAVTFAVRWMLGQAMKPGERQEEARQAQEEAGKGRTVDLVTPAEDASAPADAPEQVPDANAQFSPLAPPKLVRTDDAADAQRTAEAIRQLSEK